MKPNCLAVGIILLFLGSSIPLIASQSPSGRHIITVDDEPGLADYTSIWDAVAHANSGDIIEVYSGTYNESRINITQSNLTIQGIPHDLPGGDDTGKPKIQVKPWYTFIFVKNNSFHLDALNVTRIGDSDNGVIKIEAGTKSNISNCEIYGLGRLDCIELISSFNMVFNNNLSGANGIIYVVGMNNSICNNRIFDAPIDGIRIIGPGSNISYNSINHCDIAINFYSGGNTILMYNKIQNCSTAIALGVGPNDTIKMNEFKGNGLGILLYVSNKQPKMFTQNNFIDNKRNVYIGWGSYKPTFLTWYNNYWDNWKGFGPKRILGVSLIPIIQGPYFEIFLPIFHTGAYDLHPAKEPYDIPGLT